MALHVITEDESLDTWRENCSQQQPQATSSKQREVIQQINFLLSTLYIISGHF
jgi:hypothetical protein